MALAIVNPTPTPDNSCPCGIVTAPVTSYEWTWWGDGWAYMPITKIVNICNPCPEATPTDTCVCPNGLDFPCDAISCWSLALAQSTPECPCVGTCEPSTIICDGKFISCPATCVVRCDCPTNTTTETGTDTNTLTNTNTSTLTDTNSNTNTDSNTNTLSNTNTNTSTNTLTNTNSATNTLTNTSTTTLTNTLTNTNTNTSTLTNTLSNTSTNTNTLTNTNTATSTLTNTNTLSNTATNTLSNTSTLTNTRTNTATSTRTSTLTATNTLTKTRTSTLTNTNTNTSTLTNTGTLTNTNTATNTLTNTSTSTLTATNTSTNTSTNTLTSTRTSTLTNTNTSTLTSTNTLTSTSTTTNTLTNTSTNTTTNTLTETITNTQSYCACPPSNYDPVNAPYQHQYYITCPNGSQKLCIYYDNISTITRTTTCIQDCGQGGLEKAGDPCTKECAVDEFGYAKIVDGIFKSVPKYPTNGCPSYTCIECDAICPETPTETNTNTCPNGDAKYLQGVLQSLYNECSGGTYCAVPRVNGKYSPVGQVFVDGSKCARLKFTCLVAYDVVDGNGNICTSVVEKCGGEVR